MIVWCCTGENLRVKRVSGEGGLKDLKMRNVTAKTAEVVGY
jgi:hypothetical protein